MTARRPRTLGGDSRRIVVERAFEALTPGRQRGWLYHFGGAKQSATRTTRIDKARPAILAGKGFLERR